MTEANAPGGQPDGQEPTEQSPQPDQQQQHQPNGEVGQLRREAAGYRTQLREAQAELESLRLATKTEHERELDEARKAGYTEAENTWRGKFREATLRYEATRMLAGQVPSPKLILPHIKLDDVEMDQNGNIDEHTLQERINEVLQEFPFLLNGNGPIPSADQGPRRGNRPSGGQPHDPNSLLRIAFQRR